VAKRQGRNRVELANVDTPADPQDSSPDGTGLAAAIPAQS
jgi:hypothetical protein